MRKRAEAFEQTRKEIVWATMQLHSEQGVAATSQADVAARAGVSPATVYRHFPTLGDLVRACGVETWNSLSPPRAEDSGALYAGLDSTRARLQRFVGEMCEFYGRAWASVDGARRERMRVAELDESLRQLEAGFEALAREALALEGADESRLKLVLALTDFGVWKAFRDHGVPEDETSKTMLTLLRCVT